MCIYLFFSFEYIFLSSKNNVEFKILVLQIFSYLFSKFMRRILLPFRSQTLETEDSQRHFRSQARTTTDIEMATIAKTHEGKLRRKCENGLLKCYFQSYDILKMLQCIFSWYKHILIYYFTDVKPR